MMISINYSYYKYPQLDTVMCTQNAGALVQVMLSPFTRELVKPGTRNEEMGNDRNGKQETKNGHNCISSKHSATELAVMMKSQAYRLAASCNLHCFAEGRISCL